MLLTKADLKRILGQVRRNASRGQTFLKQIVRKTRNVRVTAATIEALTKDLQACLGFLKQIADILARAGE